MLVKDIDALVAADKDKKLAAVVNFTAESSNALKKKVKEFGEDNDLKKVPLAVTEDAKALKVSDDAQVTVMVYRRKKVKVNYALADGDLDRKTVAAIVADVKKLLAEPDEKPKEKPKTSEKSKGAKEKTAKGKGSSQDK